MKKSLIFMMMVLICFTGVNGQKQTEKLDRGLVAIEKSGGVFLGWRITGKEWKDVSYNIYRNGSKITAEALSGASNYLDAAGVAGDIYTVAAVISDIEQEQSSEVSAQSVAYFDVPIDRPSGGSTPDGNFSYTPNDASIGDLDGDGDMDIILKWDPSNSKDNSQSGYTGNVIMDAYSLEGTHMWRVDLGRNIRAGAHYTQFMVADFDGDGKAEMACKTADGTVDGLGTVIGDANADYRTSSGYILSGPEFLTIFNGETGAAMQTVDYVPARGNVGGWGDTYGNRVDRFLACVAYLDGEHPSLVMCRGYYTRTVLAAWDFDGTTLSQRWVFDSSNGYESYAGQGAHSLSVADVDNDGKDEIIYGAMSVDDDGSGLYNTRLGHGDALHVSDMDPEHPGLEVYMPHESGGNGVSFREAETGKIIFQNKKDTDVGRGVAADILSNRRGFEFWASSGMGLYDVEGTDVGNNPNTYSFRIYWDGDLYSELQNSNYINNLDTRVLTGANCSSCNGSKSTPTLSADMIGDWREELILRYDDSQKLRVFTTTSLTDYRIYTLLHDPQYRAAIAWQNVAYNQPPHASYFMEEDLILPVPQGFTGSKWKGSTGANTWDLSTSNFLSADGAQTVFANGDTAILSFNGVYDEPINLSEDISPGLLVVASPDDYTISGEGNLTGDMNLYKSMKGTLTLTGEHTYTGETVVTGGALAIDGILENSKIVVSGGAWGGKESSADRGGRIGGSGHLKGGLVLQTRAALVPGMMEGDTLFIDTGLEMPENTAVYFDLSGTPEGENDVIEVSGDLSLATGVALKINLMEGILSSGDYVLFNYSGAYTGNIEDLELSGLEGFNYELVHEGNSIILRRPFIRDVGNLSWKGDKTNEWVLEGPMNWEVESSETFFLPMDNVLFGDDNVTRTSVEQKGILIFNSMLVNSSVDYDFYGTGIIKGSGGLQKQGTGSLEILSENIFSGSTSVEEGSLWVNNSAGSATGSGDVTVSSGATLGGNGIIEGEVEMEDGAILSPGMGLGKLTINNNLTLQENSILNLDVSNEDGTYDILDADQIILNDPILNIVNNSTVEFAYRDRFKVLNANEILGGFSAINPGIPGEGLAWDTTRLRAYGWIEVKESVIGIDQEFSNKSVNLYPNPFSSILNIQISSETGINDIQLYSMDGRKIEADIEPMDGSSWTLNTNDLPIGTYVLKLESEEGVLIRKIAVKTK